MAEKKKASEWLAERDSKLNRDWLEDAGVLIDPEQANIQPAHSGEDEAAERDEAAA